ncbi:MAG: GAF and ANTAR domain-containing protein [Actinobacteria bacterium]|nr:GAF and ANTAR domain-containing protein [Actinomycetota bacterium]
MRERWPKFTPRILEIGMRSTCAFPLRLRNDRIGALNVYRAQPRAYTDDEVRLGQALADIAAVGILQERAVVEAERRAEQLQRALNSRVLIEQAKGVIAERHDMAPTAAFELLRRYARSNNRKLRDVCNELIDGRLQL